MEPKDLDEAEKEPIKGTASDIEILSRVIGTQNDASFLGLQPSIQRAQPLLRMAGYSSPTFETEQRMEETYS